MRYALLITVLLLTGCSRNEYGEADNKVLCDPKSQKAFMIQPGAGKVSFVQRNTNMDDLCK